MTGVLAASSGSISLTNTSIRMLGGANGISNNALQASGAGSQITFMGGTISTLSRGSFGALADSGGLITLGNAAQITTTGVQNTTGPVGSHALLATGTGSRINGSDITISTSGLLASGARAENGGVVSLTGSTINSSSNASADTDPSAAARALLGGQIQLTNSTITTTGQRGSGFTVQDAGSQATISGSAISVGGTRANGAFVFNGGTATVTGSSIQATTGPLVSGFAAVQVQDVGSTISLTSSTISNTAAVGYGLRVGAGGAATMTGGSSTTTGRDGPAFYAANGTITATNVVLTTTGSDNAMGALADLNGQITLNGGSVTTSGDSVRQSSYPHGLAARNPGGKLTATGTTVLTQGFIAMGAVADDGGSIFLTGNSIKTLGTTSIGLYATVEQAGTQFPATITAGTVTVETFGAGAHGAAATQHFLVAPSVITLNSSSVITHGDGAHGLRAIMAGTVNSNGSTVSTAGMGSNGLHARDNGSSVNLTDTKVSATGLNANGAVAEGGGLVTGNNATVQAAGTNGSALYVAGAPGFVSNANFTASHLTNVSGPVVGIGGNGNVSLTAGSSASGSGQWLNVATIDDFPPLAAPDAGPVGTTDPEGLETPPVFLPPAALPVVPGLANILVDNSTVEGSAFTASGSVSNLTLVNNSLWNMTGSSNITNLINDPSLIQYSAPVGDPHALASYKTLTVVTYVGEGGGIGLNTYLGDDTSPSDRLVINGGTATGNTVLHIANTSGPGALTTGNGIEVVSALNGGTTAQGAFALGNVVAAGPYEYLLFRGGVTAGSENNWFLRNESGPIPPEPPVPPPEPPVPVPPGPSPEPPGPTPQPQPFYRPEAVLYSKVTLLARQMGLLLLDTFHARKGDQFLHDDEGALWGRLIGAGLNQKFSGPLAPAFNGTIGVAQLGSDLYVSEDRDNIAGPFISFAHAAGTVRGTILDQQHALGGYLPTDAYNVGGYLTHIDKDDKWYLDAVLMGTWFKSYPSSLRGIGTHVSGDGITASLEGGYPFVLDEQWTLEPMAQIVFTSMNFDSSSDPYTTLDFIPDDAWF
ncbi:MAG TPA: autotransporter outer membrane beta-barrel domain-containing protein, partial [Rhizomicrobium sp.]